MKQFAAMVLIAFAAAAVARGDTPPTQPPDWNSFSRLRLVRAPEIDPAGAGGALTLLAGGITILRGRRTEK